MVPKADKVIGCQSHCYCEFHVQITVYLTRIRCAGISENKTKCPFPMTYILIQISLCIVINLGPQFQFPWNSHATRIIMAV